MTVPAVDIRLYATLRAYAADRPSVRAEIEPGQTVEEVLRGLGVPVEQARLIFVNSRAAVPSHPLQGGERVAVFPAIAGG